MHAKRVLVLGCILLVLVQLCQADVDDDRQRGEIERARRLRKQELRAARRLRKEQMRGKRHREEQERQHLEAGRPQYLPPQQLGLNNPQNLRPLKAEGHQRPLQDRRNRTNREGRRGGGNKRKSLATTLVRSNELEKDINRKPHNYICPANFVRLGNSCYLLSKQMLSWENAHHYCRDMNSHLAALETLWEDEDIRKYLNRKELARLERWNGGRFNWGNGKWIWGSSGKRMTYQGFSRRNSKVDRTWHCVFMDPVRHYKWSHKSCFEALHFICEAPLHKEDLPKDGNEI